MDVAMIETDTIGNKFHQADEFGLCPRCGAVMNEVDRLKVGLNTFIWLECSKSDCNGQWLQRKSNNPFFESET
jgi:hypothetical protein